MRFFLISQNDEHLRVSQNISFLVKFMPFSLSEEPNLFLDASRTMRVMSPVVLIRFKGLCKQIANI